jgi:hypothetical protein
MKFPKAMKRNLARQRRILKRNLGFGFYGKGIFPLKKNDHLISHPIIPSKSMGRRNKLNVGRMNNECPRCVPDAMRGMCYS